MWRTGLAGKFFGVTRHLRLKFERHKVSPAPSASRPPFGPNPTSTGKPSGFTVAPLKARDIFGIIVRLAGVLLLLWGIWYLSFGIAQLGGLPQDSRGEMASYFVCGIPSLVMGFIFLRRAREIVHFSYPGNQDDSENAG